MPSRLACVACCVLASACGRIGYDTLDLSDAAPPDATDGSLAAPDLADAALPLDASAPPDLALDAVSPADLERAPDLVTRDLVTPDLALPDQAMPDLAVPDLSVPDLSVPDLSVPDLSVPDLSMPDLAQPDLVYETCVANKVAFSVTGYAIGDTTSSGPGVGDFDQDGYDDVVFGNGAANNLVVYLNQGQSNPGAFNAGVAYPMGGFTGAQNLGVGDFNGDGYPDIAAPDGQDLAIVLNRGTAGPGTFALLTTLPGSQPNSVAVADVNNDHIPDIVTANNNGTMTVYISDGAGGVTNPIFSYAAGTTPLSVAVGDINNDGLADIVIANQGSNNISVFIAVSAGTYGPRVDYAVGGPGQSVALGDLDEDGYLDIAGTNYNANQWYTMMNKGSGGAGQFLAPSFHSGNIPEGAKIADFNHDGHLDIAVDQCNQSAVQVFFNSATQPGVFTSSTGVNVQQYACTIAVGYFRGRTKLPGWATNSAGLTASTNIFIGLPTCH